jgi:hypothetical protein
MRYLLSCVGSGLAADWSHTQGVLTPVNIKGVVSEGTSSGSYLMTDFDSIGVETRVNALRSEG